MRRRWNRCHDDAFVVTRRGDRLAIDCRCLRYPRSTAAASAPRRTPDAAFHWLTQAAEHGHVTAMRMLRDIYREGREGIAPDIGKATYWDERQRRKGHPER